MKKESRKILFDENFSEIQKNVRKTRSSFLISKKHRTKEFGQLK